MILYGILFKLRSSYSKSLKNQNIFSKEDPLEDDLSLLFHYSCLFFWFLLFRCKIDNWSRDIHAHLLVAHAFQVLLFLSSHCTSLCLHPSSLYISSNILLMDKLALCCTDVIYVYLISKSSKLKFKYQVKSFLKLQFG